MTGHLHDTTHEPTGASSPAPVICSAQRQEQTGASSPAPITCTAKQHEPTGASSPEAEPTGAFDPVTFWKVQCPTLGEPAGASRLGCARAHGLAASRLFIRDRPSRPEAEHSVQRPWPTGVPRPETEHHVRRPWHRRTGTSGTVEAHQLRSPWIRPTGASGPVTVHSRQRPKRC
jgi:hypothetical protein